MIMPILAIQDLQKSIAFYKDTLGFNHDLTMDGPDGKPNFAIVTMSTDSSFGLQEDVETQHRGSGVHFMVYVANDMDIDAYYADVQKRGGIIHKAIATQFWGDRSFQMIDLDGYVLELCKTVQQMTPDELQQLNITSNS